ncbi:MAG TPA: HAD-IIB family hydrolase [Nitrososphaeraceae archaeon]
MSQGVVFTDIDGTLIDIFTGHFSKTKKYVRELVRIKVPLVLCSSKTRAEQVEIIREAGLPDPFIVENGGAIFIPVGYFEDIQESVSNYGVKTTGNFRAIELGKQVAQIRSDLQSIRDNYNLKFKGVSDLSIDEISRLTDMSREAVSRMIQREYGETIIEIDKDDLHFFVTKAEELDLKVIFGGRFFDITGGNDKGTAVKLLIDLYRHKYKDDVVFFGIGDSKNDESMLRIVDYPMLVQRLDKTWQRLNIDGLNRLDGIGPEGWILAYNEILNILENKLN